LHSSRTPFELPPPDVLNPLLKLAQHNPDKFTLKLFVDSFEGANDQSFTGPQIHKGRIGKDSIWHAVHSASSFPWWRGLFSPDGNESDRKILFLVCGPEQLVSVYFLCSDFTHWHVTEWSLLSQDLMAETIHKGQ